MLDLIIRGGDVVTPQGVARCDLGIKGETIAAVAAPGTLADGDAARVIDAAGKIVMPGGIDPHVHMQHPFMIPDGTILYTQGPDRVGLAALYGGTTTLIDFAYMSADKSVRAAIEARDADFAPKSSCDWAYHLMLSSEPPHTQFAELAEAIQAGYPTIKIFTTNIWPHRTGRMIDFGDIWETFKVLAKEGGLGVIHAEDNDIVMHMYAKLIREGRRRLREHGRGAQHAVGGPELPPRDPAGRERARHGALHDARVGCHRRRRHRRGARQGPAHLRREPAPVHAAHGRGLQAAQRPDLPHLPLAQVGRGPEGAVGGHAQRRHQLRRHRRAVLHLAREDAWAAASTTPPAATPASSRGSASCTRRWWCGAAIRCRSTSISSPPTPPRSWASIPRKGAIAVGSDADIAILDPARRGKVRKEDLHETDYTPWEGHDIFAWPVVTILRGKVVVENGQFLGRDGAGQYLKRKIPAEIIAGPML